MEESHYIEILNREMVKSLGCTEPITITYATALARTHVKGMVTNVEINASQNLIKNATSVTIPGIRPNEIEFSSIFMASALGIIKPNPEKKLEILSDVNNIEVENAKELISEGIITLNLIDSEFKLYLEVIVKSSQEKAKVVIANSHNNVILIEVNDQIIKKVHTNENPLKNKENLLDLSGIVDFVRKVDLNKLPIIQESIEINKKICLEGLETSYGLNVGKNINLNRTNGFFSEDIISQVISFTAAGSDARMSGCQLPAMSNSGSGNQGISTTIPVVVVAEKLDLPLSDLLRAVTLSNLIAIYIKSRSGRLSAMCGAIISATGASCGVTYLLGGRKPQIESTIQLMLANITGMVCDGAKSGCALKIATCTYAAMQSALLSVNGAEINDKEGIIEKSAEETIENFCNITSESMVNVDHQIMDIMLKKMII